MPVISQPFAVSSLPRDQLIQALQDLKNAVSAYQAACINVFAAADVQLAEYITNNAQVGSLAEQIYEDLASNSVGAVASLLTDTATGDAFSLAKDFVLPLALDLVEPSASWILSSISDWQQLGWMGSNLTTADLQNYFTGKLTPALDSVQAYLTKITNQINQIADPNLSGFPEASVISNLKDLTNKVHSFTPQTGTTLEGEVGWAVPGVDLSAMGNLDPILLVQQARKPSTSLMRRE